MMTTLIFYEKPGCATNARQKRLLLDASHEVIARNLLSEPWTAQRLQDYFAALPVADWFNRAAPQLKSGEIDPALIDAQAALEMLLSDPLLIRRPLIEADGWHLAGFDAAQIELRLGAAAHGEAPPDLENCSRPDAATPCATPQNSAPQDTGRAQVALAYHERTKHRPDRYASGPETLDWTMQPDPFRTFKGSPSIRLPHCASRMALAFEHADKPEAFHPPAVTLYSLGALLELSLGLSAWKEYGPDRLALRCNPSSGNLHPTEAYVVSHGIKGLQDGLYITPAAAMRWNSAATQQQNTRLACGSACPPSTGAKPGNTASAPSAIASSMSVMRWLRCAMPPASWDGTCVW